MDRRREMDSGKRRRRSDFAHRIGDKPFYALCAIAVGAGTADILYCIHWLLVT
jgi:hypothetical protein